MGAFRFESLSKIFSLFKANYTGKQKLISFAIGTGFSIIIVLLVSYNLLVATDSFEYNPFSFIDNQIVDSFFIRRYKTSRLEDLVDRNKAVSLAMVNIDDESLLDMKVKWPIPRTYYAKLLEKLKKAKAKTIGIDITFVDPSNEAADMEFARVLSEMNNVFLAKFFYLSKKVDVSKMGSEEEQDAILVEAKPYEPFTVAVQREGRNRLGFVSTEMDVEEKVIRRLRIAMEVGGKQHYHLSVLMAAHFLGIPEKELSNHPGEKYFKEGNIIIPTCQDKMRINYVFPPGELSLRWRSGVDLSELINEIPAKYVLMETDEKQLESFFKDKIVLIGPVATAAGDIKSTPFGDIPGVYANANIILSILSGKFMKPASPSFNIAVVICMGILIGLVIPRLSPIAGAVFVLILCGGYYQWTYYSFVKHGVINFITSPILCAFFGFLVINVYHHLVEIRAKESISRMFKEFAPVPTQLIEKYVEEYGGSAATGGELAHMSILFSDIRGYTQMSEGMSSQEVMDVLNQYHQAMGEVFAQTGGVVFKYIGDAQLVVYGLEGPSKINHAAASIKAGLLMQEKMDQIRHKLEQGGHQAFDIGVGICTGSLSIGVVGSDQLKSFDVIGDTVNVASRIQGMSRELSAPVLVHERTYLMAKHCIEADQLRPVKLKGKAELVNVYRAKKVLDITPYPGDEIKDLDKEVEELHRMMEEARKKRMEERERQVPVEPVIKEPGKREMPVGVRQRERRSKREKALKPTEVAVSLKEVLDDLEPFEEKSKGEVPDDFEPIEEKSKGSVADNPKD